jgi:putative DNA primase/helicase
METEEGESLSPKRFITELWKTAPPDSWVEFIFLWYENPTSAPKFRGAYFIETQKLLQNADQILGVLASKNAQHLNIHPGVNPRKIRPAKRGKNKDIEHYVALWLDTDDDKHDRRFIDERIKFLTGEGVPPSAVLETGHGRHFYWLLDRPYPVAEAVGCIAGLVDVTQADPVFDPSRVLRLPGTSNVKDRAKPMSCRIVEATWTRYPLAAFTKYAVDVGKIDEPDDEKLSKSENEIERIKQGVGEGGRNVGAAKLAGHYLGRGLGLDETRELLRSWNAKNDPPMSDEELETTLASIARKEDEKPKKEKKKKRDRGDAEKYFEGNEFLPQLLANDICAKWKILATPVNESFTGTNLYVYENGVYAMNLASALESELRRALEKNTKPERIIAAIDLIRRSQKIEYTLVNPKAKELINLKNGMLDWKTGEILPHSPDYLSTIQLNAEYDPSATCPELDQFLKDVVIADALPMVEEWIGYLMIPDTGQQKMFIASGPGGNGKGTFLKIVSTFLGEENTSSISLFDIAEDRFSTAGLFGKLANFRDDLDTEKINRTGKMKAIVSGDAVNAEYKGRDQFRFRPFARHIFATNHLPHTSDFSEGYFDRFVITDFPNRIRGTAKDIKDYDAVLMSRPHFFSALLNKALVGLRRLKSQGKFTYAESTQRELEEYKSDNNTAYTFILEHCNIGEGGRLTRSEIYQHYQGWCRDEGIRRPMPAKFMVKVIKTLPGVKASDAKGIRGWGGLAWKNGGPPTNSQNEIDALSDDTGGEF